MQIKLVRHAQSESNAREVNSQVVGDHNVALTSQGWNHGVATGGQLVDFLVSCLLYRSPYKRTRQTLDAMLEGATKVLQKRANRAGSIEAMAWDRIYEDPRLREVEWGLGIDDPSYWEKIEKMKEDYGSFYVRRPNGESCADCYDRCSAFVGTMMRQIARKDAKKVLVVSHGLTIRCLIASFMHLTIEQFECMRNPRNCDVITISNEGSVTEPQFTCGQWGVSGLILRKETI